VISFDDLKKALEKQRIVASSLVISTVLNELQPNPCCGFGVGGVQVWGDQKSIEHVRRWHHDSVETVPALRRAFNMDDRYLHVLVCVRNEQPEDTELAAKQVQQAIDNLIDEGRARVSFASVELLP
jgi:hypothetical protein